MKKSRQATKRTLDFLTAWANVDADAVWPLVKRFPEYAPPGFKGAKDHATALSIPSDWTEDIQEAWRLPDAESREWKLIVLLAKIAGNKTLSRENLRTNNPPGIWQAKLAKAVAWCVSASARLGVCERCDRCFLKTTEHVKRYCSRKCGAAITAKAAMERHRARKHDAMLETAREAVSEYVQCNRRKGWKDFAVERINQVHRTAITAKSLSRWVKAGELQEPKQKGGKA